LYQYLGSGIPIRAGFNSVSESGSWQAIMVPKKNTM
jgi:hypothetical protein